jgi:multiple sugar transport system permease protein
VAFPLYWLVTASFKDALAIHQGPTFVPWVDFQPTADAWTRLAAGAEGEMVGGPLLNSVLVGGTSSLLAMALGASAAYGLARARVRLGPMANEDILFWMVSQRLMPPIVTALALFLMLRTVALLDTRTGLLLVYVAFNLPLATWLMYNFLRHVPASVEEAAWVDGASRGQALVHVLLPVSLPGLVATFLFCFMFAWNEFLFALVLTFNRARTLPILIAAQHSQKGIEWWSLSAMSLITLAPVVLITLLLQRYLVAQVLRGSEG